MKSSAEFWTKIENWSIAETKTYPAPEEKQSTTESSSDSSLFKFGNGTPCDFKFGCGELPAVFPPVTTDDSTPPVFGDKNTK